MSEAAVKDESGLDSLVGRVADEFLRRQEAGERPDVEEYVARHPEAADLLRRVLASLRVLDHSLSGVPQEAANGDGAVGTLGDFRIVREVGRGGMGIVYEAEQLSLGRRVALKVLPFAATMDPRQLQRFHNEARAAAGLHHTNIVPVYAVGCERGVHFYAMQFIEGQTLAALIAEPARRGDPAPLTADQPTTPHVPAAPAADTAERAAASTERPARDAAYFRRVAGWGIQAAEALDHAHQLGIVHRDVKPANLMIDAAGCLWVTDFGLAQVQSEARVTMTGDLVGTLRYMSPEQALAQRVVIDHRTDVYSLGATLYELLTSRPAFDGADRQELLRQIAFEEPKPPRRLNRAIPHELETIVLKALEKNPRDRYATAQELADDLRRWLEDRPIRARPPTPRQRVTRWARRHQAIAWAALVILIVTVPVLTFSTIWALHMNGQTAVALKEADDRRREAVNSAEKERQAAGEAQRESRRADNNFRQAIEEINELIKATRDDPGTGRTPQLEEVRDAQGDLAFAFYQRLLQENRTDPAGRQQAGLVYYGLIYEYFRRGDAARAAEAYRQSVAVFRQLSVEFPAEVRYQEELEKSQGRMQDTIQSLYVKSNRETTGGHYKEVVKCWQQAVILSEALTTEQPDESANWRVLGTASCWLGRDLWLAGRRKEAEEALSKASAVFAKLGGDTEDVPETAWLEATNAYLWRGSLRSEAGRLPEAEADYRQALALCEKLAKADEGDKFWFESSAMNFAGAQEALGNVLWATDRQEEAAAAFRRAEEIRQEVLDLRRDKSSPNLLYQAMARFYATCPDKRLRKPAKAVELAKKAVEIAETLEPRPSLALGDSWNTLGVAQYRAGEWKAAVTGLEKATQLPQSGANTAGFFLAMAHWQLGDKDQAHRCYDKAVQWMETSRPHDPELIQLRAEAAALLGVGQKKD
jgi:serine/threonine protein kinase